jgi:hypothetical protein
MNSEIQYVRRFISTINRGRRENAVPRSGVSRNASNDYKASPLGVSF